MVNLLSKTGSGLLFKSVQLCELVAVGGIGKKERRKERRRKKVVYNCVVGRNSGKCWWKWKS